MVAVLDVARPACAGPPGPVLAGWADLDQREDAADIGPGHPILIDPEYRLDPVLARFLGRSRFAWLAEGTRQAYAKDYRLFFSFLWQRGKYWHEADPDDLLDWEAWRRRDQQPGRGIGGSKWQRELAALRLVYEWAEKEQHIARSPVLVHQVRLRGGGTATAADQAPRDVRSADVKWVTPRTYRLWRDIGLLGYDAAGQPDPSWRGRNDGRNAAFTDLLFSSGLRLREGGCLLTLEVPDAVGGHGYYEGTVAGAVAKRRQRMFYASAAALRRVAGYVATTRADAVRRARRHRRYEQVPGKLIVTKDRPRRAAAGSSGATSTAGRRTRRWARSALMSGCGCSPRARTAWSPCGCGWPSPGCRWRTSRGRRCSTRPTPGSRRSSPRQAARTGQAADADCHFAAYAPALVRPAHAGGAASRAGPPVRPHARGAQAPAAGVRRPVGAGP